MGVQKSKVVTNLLRVTQTLDIKYQDQVRTRFVESSFMFDISHFVSLYLNGRSSNILMLCFNLSMFVPSGQGLTYRIYFATDKIDFACFFTIMTFDVMGQWDFDNLKTNGHVIPGIRNGAMPVHKYTHYLFVQHSKIGIDS